MKRIFILVTVLAVIAAGCKNYDDRFDDLNSQIATLTTQVQALQGVATQVTSLQTEIGNIRKSIQDDIETAVAGVSTTLGTNLQSAQTALNGEIAKLQTALTQAAANNLTQADIDKLKSELQTTLAAAQKTTLDTALETLQAKLTELEKTLATAASGALSQADLDKLKEEIETQLAQVKEDLEESLGEGGFHSGEVTIDSSGSWEFTKRQLSDKTEFSGNFTIDTGSLTDAEVDELIGWVAEITLINGDLTITHKDKDKVIKFAKLSSVTNLDDRQPHAHYPELTGVLGVSLSGDAFKETLSVKLPKITKTTFKDGQIVLPKLEQGDDDNGFDLSSLASYEGDLTIQTNDKVDILLNALASIDAEKNDGTGRDKKLLTIDGGKNVHLDVLASVKGLIIEDVKHLEAPIVQEAELTIKGDVISVDIATGEGDKVHIKKLTIDEAGELKTLKFRGKSNLKNVVFNNEKTGDLETLEIHGLESVELANLDRLESLTTAGTIKTLTIKNTDLRGELTLGHESGDNGVLRVSSNAGITSLKADKVNKLSTLIIQGNSKLETISFEALNESGAQKYGEGDEWFKKDAIIIGAYDQEEGFEFKEDLANNLVAEKYFKETKKANNTTDKKGEITDNSGLKGLETFLTHVKDNNRRAVVSYDGADEFATTNAQRDEPEEDEANTGDNLLLFRKGIANVTGKAVAAKRVFLVDTGAISDLSSSEDLQIGVNDNDGDLTDFYVPIDLTAGGSVNNHVVTINDEEIKKSFDTNNVLIHAEAGGHPTGTLRFNVNADAAPRSDAGNFDSSDIGDDDATNNPVGSLKLTIGNERTGVYSHEVILQVVDDDNPLKDDVAFSATEKKAKTFINADNNTNDATNHGYGSLDDLANILISAFPRFSGTDPVPYPVRPGVEHVPFGISGRTGTDNAIVGLLDAQKIPEKTINVKVVNNIKQTSAANAKGVDFFIVGGGTGDDIGITQKNIKNNPNTIQITLTSKVAGKDESTIGVPTDDVGGTDTSVATDYILPNSDIATTPGAYVYVGTSSTGNSKELPIAEANPRASSLPKAGADDAGAQTRGGEDVNRLGWL